MKTDENHLLNVKFANLKPIRDGHCSHGIDSLYLKLCRKALPLRFVSLSAAAFFVLFPSAQAKGSSGGHPSAMGSHENGESHGHYRSPQPFWDSYSSYNAGIYDSTYSYTPTPEQRAVAKHEAERYLLAVHTRKRHAPTQRYISVETLRPTHQQLDDYNRKHPAARQADLTRLHCLMIFDTQSKEFVGSHCYIVGSEPSIGQLERFEGTSAEFVGQQKLQVD
jgi:hypothetical protein